MIAALIKSAGTTIERDTLKFRAKDAESVLETLNEILNSPDFASLPRIVTQMATQRHVLKNAQVQLEEEVSYRGVCWVCLCVSIGTAANYHIERYAEAHP